MSKGMTKMNKAKKSFIFTTTALLFFGMTASNSAVSDTKEEDVLGSAQPSGNHEDSDKIKDLYLEINSLDRSPSGGLTSLAYTIENKGKSESESMRGILRNADTYKYGHARDMRLNAPTLVNGETKYLTIMDSEDDCLCPRGTGANDIPDEIPAGESVPIWSSYWVPDDVSTVTVEVPGFDPIKDVPIS
ncbi:hypothetical protein [Haloactinospora alba]|uniref:hypothetical protein n=1 Tax=Haloactinospora alba TaxID=405555 RepID=UPI00114FCC2B|nr:hypothetical protein [Haloactinospora alba]